MSKKITDENGNTYVQKKPFYKKWWFWLVIVILIVGGCAAMGGSEDTPTAKDDSSTEQSSAKKEENKEFKVGQTISLNGIDMKVDEVKFLPKGEMDSISDDEQFVAVKVTLKNVDNSTPADYNALDFRLSADGNKTEFTETPLDHDDITNNTLESGSLDKGASVSGWLVGKAKKDAKKLQLQYTGSFFEENSKIDVNLK